MIVAKYNTKVIEPNDPSTHLKCTAAAAAAADRDGPWQSKEAQKLDSSGFIEYSHREMHILAKKSKS